MAKKLEDNEVQLGPQKIGPNTIVQINLKTFFVLLGILGSGLWYAWSDLSKKLESSDKSSAQQINKLQEEIKSIKDQDLKIISSQLNQVDGKVQGIFINMQRDNYTPNNISNLKVPENKAMPANPK